MKNYGINKALMKEVLLFIIFAIFSINILGQSVETIEPNSFGGYDYYDDNNNFIGHSESDDTGGYIYYDDSGNQTGSLTPTSDGDYAIYDAEGVETGSLESLPSQKYRHKSSFVGDVTELEPLAGDYEDVATINPADLFQEQ